MKNKNNPQRESIEGKNFSPSSDSLNNRGENQRLEPTEEQKKEFQGFNNLRARVMRLPKQP